MLDVANALLPDVAVGVPAATSVRSHEDSLAWGTPDELVEAVEKCLSDEGSIGVIVPDARVRATLKALRDGGVESDDLQAGSDGRVSVVAASEAKSLEFDFVVLLEPAQIVEQEPTRSAGLRRLYVLTRAVTRLIVLHDAPLPAELTTVQ